MKPTKPDKRAKQYFGVKSKSVMKNDRQSVFA